MTDEQSVTSEQAAQPGATKPKKTRKSKSKSKPTEAPTNGASGPVALTANDILGADDIRTDKLFIDEWPSPDGSPGYVIVHGLSSAAHEKLIQSSMDMDPVTKEKTFNMVGYQSKLTVLGSFNDDGDRIFSDEHQPLLAAKASGPIAKIATLVQELSGLGGEAVERLKKNLGLTTTEDSPSA